MATNTKIFEARLLVKDPIGYIAIIEVANAAALPVSPAAQTLYFLTDVKEYHAYEDNAWVRQDIIISNDRIGLLCDLYTDTNQVASKLVNDLISHYGQLLALSYKSHDDGSESFDKQSLSDLLAFYKNLKGMFDDEQTADIGMNTGRYARTKKPLVGGML